jgi:hypothetical protein
MKRVLDVFALAIVIICVVSVICFAAWILYHSPLWNVKALIGVVIWAIVMWAFIRVVSEDR